MASPPFINCYMKIIKNKEAVFHCFFILVEIRGFEPLAS